MKNQRVAFWKFFAITEKKCADSKPESSDCSVSSASGFGCDTDVFGDAFSI